MDSTRNILIIFLIVLIFYLLTLLSSLLIPLVLALLFAIIFQPLVNLFKKWKLPDWVILPTVSVITLGVLYALFTIILQTSYSIASEKEYLVGKLNEKVEILIAWAGSAFNIDADSQAVTESIDNLFNAEFLTTAAGNVAGAISSFAGSFFMFALYYITILTSLSNYKQYLSYLGGDSAVLLENYEKVSKSIFSYMIIKTLISLSTAVAVGVVCWAFGVRFPVFWGFLTFLLNFIPSIGSIFATLPPVLMSVIQYDFKTALILLVCLIGVQSTIGNVVEPKIMGNRLRLNTVTVIFGLVFWGYLWGISGMILSVPMMIILKLIFEHIPSLNIFARLMGYPEPEKKVKEKAG